MADLGHNNLTLLLNQTDDSESWLPCMDLFTGEMQMEFASGSTDEYYGSVSEYYGSASAGDYYDSASSSAGGPLCPYVSEIIFKLLEEWVSCTEAVELL